MTQRKNVFGLSLQHRVQAFDEQGKILSDTGFQRSRSFLKQFMQVLYIQLSQLTITLNVKDLDGALRTIAPYAYNLRMKYHQYLEQDSSLQDFGIQIGSGNAVLQWDDYVLDNRISHGQSANQMIYGDWNRPAGPNADGDKMLMFLTRCFSNNSGGSVTVREIGITGGIWSSWYCLFVRDVLASEVVVPNGGSLHVQYRIIANT